MAWAKIPTAWVVQDKKLPVLSWQKHRSDATAALILLIALTIRCNQLHVNRNGAESTTTFSDSYDRLHADTLLSRAKIAAGLRLLKELGIVEITRQGRINQFCLTGIKEFGKWAQLPQTQILVTAALRKFHLRHRHELNALKLYVLLLAFRARAGNFTAISYEKIGEWSGLTRNDIASAVSLLINLNLIHYDAHDPEPGQIGRPHNRYKIRGL